MRLSSQAAIPETIIRPLYDRAAQKCGIVHFGIGAFHRAHQAAYTDDAMNAGDRDWAITGVSLRSAGVADQMNPQDGLYTLSERSGEQTSVRLIGAVKQVLVASQQREEVLAAIASSDTKIISFTITEKGYCRAPDGSLDFALAGLGSVYDYLYAGLARRMASGRDGLTLLSCDNLADNGAQLARLLAAHLQARDPALAEWVQARCKCPATMVDRIVPATTDADRDGLEKLAGLRDEAAVLTEPFTQWVIEDSFAGPRPRWEIGGAQFTADVRPFETAKLRMLNGAHSALAYLGLARGHTYVHQAIADPALLPLIERLMRTEAATSLTPAPGQDLAAYAASLATRFGNTALNHKLRQIAMDGSQKIPQRWLETLAFHQREGRQCPAILAAISAWVGFVGKEGLKLDDPLAEVLHRLWQAEGASGMPLALFGDRGLFAQHWVATKADLDLICATIGQPA
ncbi:mannitol dehydrogenase family protein [Novosphingobium sp.]|uniref:mannitol dehydrogenase family protein n=1 Tax=Novosphingobium sp. TaxID=1874826 RepID=UPI0025E51C30|nr:mannitol dehydrogenase family protein [Novosphingobium sp.]